MEVLIHNICPYATLPELKRTIADVLHGPDFEDYHTLPLNFDIFLLRQSRPDARSAKLTLPSVEVGEHFMSEYAGYRPRMKLWVGESRKPLSFKESRNEPWPELVHRINQTPYVDPQEEEEQLELAAELRAHLVRVSAVQFGWECRDHVFSIEHERRCGGTARMRFDGEHRQFRLRIHQQDNNSIIAIRASQVSWVSIGMDPALGLPVLFFSLLYPPTFEHEPPTSVSYEDEFDMADVTVERPDGPSRWRLSSFDGQYEERVEFTSLAMRMVCESEDSARNFRWICQQAHITLRNHVYPVARRDVFAPSVINEYASWVATLPWAVAFQVSAILRANVMDPQELLRLRPHLAEMMAVHGETWTASFVRFLGTEARSPEWYQSQHRIGSVHSDIVMELFSRCRNSFVTFPSRDTREETFDCYHAVVMPTRVLLDGPFPERNNRVMRRYPNHTSNFLRVSFADENRLQYRFERDVDGHKFIEERFGDVLFDGLDIAGRHFEFLAYSQSGLKQHSVWFVTPFTMPSTSGDGSVVEVTADTIIQGLGVFHGIPQDPQLMRCPARYGARIAQAFTTTEAAVEVQVGEVIEVPDIMDMTGKRSFTDGVGLMSRELAEDVWEALRSKSASHRRAGRCIPKAIQIRFQGYKGMLNVDPFLTGRAIRLRPSMKKFEAPQSRMLEVAAVFNRPTKFYLNRPLIMLLEGLGVRGGYQVFKNLQDAVIQDTKEATKSLQDAATLCEGYGLGSAFKLTSVFLDLVKLGIKDLDDAFSRQVLNFGIYHILRDLKYRARIPVPGGYSLVGVADVHGYLEEGEIFACVARSDDEEPTYLEGLTMITRSPTIHPGDVQVVKAIGRPPPGTIFDIEPLTNTVVFSTKGSRPLASCLSGGDLDGDVFVCTTMPELLPSTSYMPADYNSAERKTVPHISTRDDVAEFIMEYLYSDRIGMIASTWLVLADQSNAGIFDEACLWLASLHSDAADYPKTGNPVSPKEIPRYKLPNMKPDWNAPELTDSTGMGLYYKSRRFIGRLYREIQLSVPSASPPSLTSGSPLTSKAALRSFVREAFIPQNPVEKAIHRRVSEFYATEPFTRKACERFNGLWETLMDFVQTLRQISVSFSISHRRSVKLTEEEIVAGTIIAQSTQPRVRQEAVSQMREQASILVNSVAAEVAGPEDGGPYEALKRAWLAYRISTLRPHEFGFRSFGLVAMHEIFVAIRSIETRERESEPAGVAR